jgi:hypothetical protein
MTEEQKQQLKQIRSYYIIIPMIFWSVGYVIIMILNADFDFRNWNTFSRIFYAIYITISTIVLWNRIGQQEIATIQKFRNENKDE